MSPTPGKRFRAALLQENPLQIIGTINAYAAMMAKEVGFRAIYLSGSGVASASYGLPDLGMTTLDNVLTDVQRITGAVDLPLLVDIDTGWGSPLMLTRSIQCLEKAGAAAVHIEDQPFLKRCGHRQKKRVVSQEEMCMRLKTATDARVEDSFIIMARTDAYACEGLERTIERCLAYEEAGADMHFIEALPSLDDYRDCVAVLNKPILANITEFGQTPLFNRQELSDVGVSMILYPLSAWRAMNLAALRVYDEIRTKGTQKLVVEHMQTREELYHYLNYYHYENLADTALTKDSSHD